MMKGKSMAEEIIEKNDEVSEPEIDGEIKDKTEFESVQNHVHVLDRITKKEYILARNYMLKRGIDEGFVQELSSAREEYTPAFDLTGV